MAKLILRVHRLPAEAPDVPYPAGHRHVVDLDAPPPQADASTPLARWSAAVAPAHDACLLLDDDGRIVALSEPASDLLGCAGTAVIGRRLLDVLPLVDFDTGEPHPDYAGRIAPLAAVGPDASLTRSLLRLRRADGGQRTLDASAAPLHDAEGAAIGSLTFLAPIGH